MPRISSRYYILITVFSEWVKEYKELSGVREEKTRESEMEATYSLRCWQRWRDVLVAEVLNGAMNSTRLALYASRNFSGIFL